MDSDEQRGQGHAEVELLKQQLEAQKAMRSQLEAQLAASRAALDALRATSHQLALLQESAPIRLAAAVKHPLKSAAREFRTRGRLKGQGGPVRELFDAAYYRWAYTDVAGTDEEVWLHYLTSGAAEGRNPSAAFDVTWYRAQYPDVSQAGLDPVVHWLEYGAAEGRDPHPLFSTKWYLDENPDVLASGANPLLHFLRFGAFESRDPHPFFDVSWYLEAYPDVAVSGRDPLSDYLTEGAALGRNPNPDFYSTWYLTQYPDAARSGLNPLVHYVLHGRRSGRPTTPSGYVPMVVSKRRWDRASTHPSEAPAARDLIRDRWSAQQPLRVFSDAGPGRVVLVTDSISRDSLFGGVATSLILGALWSMATGRALRVVTRTAIADPEGFARVLDLAEVPLTGNPEFIFHGSEERDFLDLRPDDVFLTTSWWSTAAVRGAVDPARVVYLLQEDERLFYPAGDDWVRAEAEMSDGRSLVVVNSQRLHHYLLGHGCRNLADRGLWFDASFAAFSRLRGRRGGTRGPKRELFFYSRPNNPRNLFYLGLAALSESFETGALNPDDWIVHLVGPGTPRLTLPGSVEVQIHHGLDWIEYSELLPRIDVGVSLMATPHSSYPPVDLAAAGAWVVTNRWTGKDSLPEGGERLIVADASVKALVDALRRAASESLSNSRIPDAEEPRHLGWPDQLAPVIARLVEEFGGV